MNSTYWKRTMAVLGAGAALCVTSIGAEASDVLLNKLVEKGILTQREANEIRAELDAEDKAMVAAYNTQKTAKWVDSMTWSGDLRLRAEYFDYEDSLNKPDRLRYRYRFRFGFTTEFNEWAKIGVRLASGSDPNDPLSTNQTIGDYFRRDIIGIDLAYVTLTPPALEWLSITGGKMNNPIWQTKLSSPMVYDGDLNPEGVAEQINLSLGDSKRYALLANFGQWAFREDSASSDTDGYLFEFQGGIEAKLGGDDAKNAPIKATLAGGYYITQNAQSVPALDAGFFNFGNSRDGGGQYLDDFEVVSVRGEVEWRVSDKPFLGTPCKLTLSGEYINNLAEGYDVADQTEGYSGQIAFGGNKKKGEWQVAYQYKNLEADATWDAMTDSDWGNGGTDRRGHVVKGSYNLLDWWQLGLTAFITEQIGDVAHKNAGFPGETLLRLQADTVFKF
jgi:hypothetical protein